MATKVSNYFLSPGTNRGRHPATMGSSWTCNMYLEKGEGTEFLASVPGLKYEKTLLAGTRCRGSFVSSVGLETDEQRENCFAVFGSRAYRIDSTGNVAELGQVAPGASRISFAETGGVRPFLLMADGTNLWAYNLVDGGTLRRVTLPDRVNGGGGQIAPSHVCCVAGSVVIDDASSGFAYYSVPYPLNTPMREVFQTQVVDGKRVPVYDPNNSLKILTEEVDSFDWMFYDSYGTQQFINASSSSDNIRAIAAVGPNLYLFGYKTVEIWQRGSGEYETWTRQSYTTNASNGLQAPHSIAVCGSNLYYLGSGESYAKGVLMVSGQSYSKVSPDWLDDKLLGETGDSAFAFAYAQGNHVFYCLFCMNLGECWAYDTETGQWAQRTSRVFGTGEEVMWRPSAMAWFRGGFHAFCDDGCMYSFSESYWWEDYGNGCDRLPVIRHRQGAVVVNDEKPFVFNELTIECDVGCWEDYSLQPELLLQVSRDGGNTFGNVRSCKMGRTGDYSHRVRFMGLGMNRLCVLRATYSHPTSLEITACSQRVTPTTGVI
jgi:hypothetical protein